MKRLVWRPMAMADRNAIMDYIAQDNPTAAVALDELFAQKAARLLGHMPSMGRAGRVPGTREFVAHRNYILIYDVTGDEVRILRVMHAARQWPLQES